MPPVPTGSRQYQSYLVRLWREEPQGVWRASVQSTATQQVYYFVTLEALFAFLEGRLATGETHTPPGTNRDPPDG